MGSHLVQRTANAHRPTVEHMGVEHRRFDIAMAQQLQDGSNVITAFEQVGGECMADSSSIDEISQGFVKQAKIR